MTSLTATRIIEEPDTFVCGSSTCTESLEPRPLLLSSGSGGFQGVVLILGERLWLMNLSSCRRSGAPSQLGEELLAGPAMTLQTASHGDAKEGPVEPSIMELATGSLETPRTGSYGGMKGRSITIAKAREKARQAVSQATQRYKKATEWEAERGFRFEDE